MALYNDGSPCSRPYDEMMKVALSTALHHTDLEPYLLYDGVANEFTEWMEQRGTTLISCRTFLYEPLRALSRELNNADVLTIGAGTYLRLEIPRLAHERSWHDEFVLYTDCDLIFTGGVSELNRMKPRYFAAAPEIFQNNYLHLNAGVMLLNVPALQQKDEEFRAFNLQHLRRLVNAGQREQGAYRTFYNAPHRILASLGFPDKIGYRALYPYFSRYKWDELPQIFNWKPYWPKNADARILHFHGPKPWHRARQAAGEFVPPTLVPMMGENYQHACDLYENQRARFVN